MATYPFLSQDWIEAARKIRAAHLPEGDPPAFAMRMNLTVEEVPHDTGLIEAHVDTSTGVLDIELGHLDDADVKVTLDYETARAVLIDNDAEAAMGAFMAGRVRVEGDMTKLLTYQSMPPSDAQRLVGEELKAITEGFRTQPPTSA